jgi:putative hemolysin
LKREVLNAVDMETWSPVFRGEFGKKLAELFIKLFAIDKVNMVYDRSFDYSGAEFAASLLNDLGVNYRIGNVERLAQLPDNSFITVSNHPYGGLDGIMLIDLMAGIRSDYKIMVNKLLSLIKTMDDNFISVKPVGNKKIEPTANINGIRETLTHLRGGHPVGFFPSGAVSDFSLKELHVRDRRWQDSIIKLIQSAKVPIIPIRFFDKNSAFFYSLGLIDWRIRLIRMPREIFNKRKQNPRIGIGEIISVEEQEQFSDLNSFGSFIRNAVYDMPVPTDFTPPQDIKFTR